MPQLRKYLSKDNIRKNSESLYTLNDRIKKGKIHATFDESSQPTYHVINTTLHHWLMSKGTVPYRIGAKENVDASWTIHFPEFFKIAFDFLNDKVTFFGTELADFDDAGIFEDIFVEVYIISPTSTWDPLTIH